MPRLPETERSFLITQLTDQLSCEIGRAFGSLIMPTSSLTLYSLVKIKKDVEMETHLGETKYFVTFRYADSFQLSSGRLEVS